MAQLNWEKAAIAADAEKPKNTGGGERLKFLVGGLLILGAVAFLIINSTVAGARFFITVDDVTSNPDYLGQTVRITGVVLGPSIEYNSVDGDLAFTIAHIPSEFEDLATVLHESARDSSMRRLEIVMNDQTKPDLLQHEAQAILTGYLGDDGRFHANELLLKCPSRFEEHTPDMLASTS